MTIEQILEIIERYKLRIPPTVYYDLLADIREAEEEQKPTTKNDLGVDCIKKSDAIKIIQDMHGLARVDVISDAVNTIITMPPVTPQEPKTGHWIIVEELHGEWEGTKKYACDKCGEKVGVFKSNYCPNCGSRNEVEE